MFEIVHRVALSGAVASVILVLHSCPVAAQVSETRSSSANPMVEVFRSTLYGGLAGVLLGSAVALAKEDDDGSETVRWGFVGGTFFGFGFGIHHVYARPQPGQAALQLRDGEWALAPPTVTCDHAAPAAGWSPPSASETTLRATLASVDF
ncbi:MAG: hypothetical protein DHS20C21_14070 [Gemmatimonadota bacterium]|nr:MAG: hypothetical protein DHS20C21_14070 [Gemmatimonadota bacterium]